MSDEYKVFGLTFRPFSEIDREVFENVEEGSLICYKGTKTYTISPHRKRIEIIDEHGKSEAWIAEAPRLPKCSGQDIRLAPPASRNSRASITARHPCPRQPPRLDAANFGPVCPLADRKAGFRLAEQKQAIAALTEAAESGRGINRPRLGVRNAAARAASPRARPRSKNAAISAAPTARTGGAAFFNRERPAGGASRLPAR
jgi:hypothetical protein